MASFANAGLYSMILSGLCLEYIGPRYNFLVGGCLASMGYFFLWAIATVKVSSTIVTSCMSLYLGTFGTSFFSVTCTTLVVTNWPTRDRGKAVGIMKAFLGLGISINSQFYSTFFDDLDYLLGLAITLPLVAILCASVVNYVPRKELEYSKVEAPDGKAVFWYWFALIGATALWVGTAVLLDDELTLDQWAKDLLFVPTVILIVVGIAFLPFQYGPLKLKSVNGVEPVVSEEEMGLLGHKAAAPELYGNDTKDGNEFSLIQMLSTPEFWLLFGVFAIGSGVCLTVSERDAGSA